MKHTERSLFIRKILFTLISVIGYSIIANNFYLLSRDVIYGDYSGEKIFPKPLFGFFRIPEFANTREHNAVNKLAVDFAQIYFPSQEMSSLTKNYETGYLDPLGRQSRYAPVTHYICSISLCKLDYGQACFLHLIIQLLLFYFFFIYTFKILKIETDLWLGFLLLNLLLFATPTGLGWFERGQFSLYVALSYLLLLLGYLKNKPVLILLSALFAYIKWTSFPFLFLIHIVYLLSSKNTKEAVQNIRMAFLYFLIIVLLSLPFRNDFIPFIKGLFMQERHIPPTGISMAIILNANFVKASPLILILLGYFYLRRNNKDFNSLIPYLIGSGIFLLTYPTVANEYSIANIFCFIPILFYWTKHSGIQSTVARIAFFFFLTLISFPGYLNLFIERYMLLTGYFTVSVIFLSLPIIHRHEFLLQPSEKQFTQEITSG